MPTPWDQERAVAQRERLQIAQGQWDEILHDWVAEHVDEQVMAAAWGKVDTSVNVLGDICRQLTTPGLYGRRPTVRHRTADVDAFSGPEGLLERAGWYTRGQRLQYLTMCLGDMFVRFSAYRGRLVYRFAYPHDVFVRVAEEDPTEIVELWELRERCFRLGAEQTPTDRYTWDVYDLRDPENPTFRTYLPGGEDGLERDVTQEVHGETFDGDAYPWRNAAGQPQIPYVHYQDADAGQPWNHMLRAGITRGTMNAALYASYTGNCARHATGSNVIVYGLEMPGTKAGRGGDSSAASSPFVPVTPGAMLFLAQIQGQTPGVVEVGPGVNLPDVAAFAMGYEQAQAVRWGLPASEVTRQAANPTSAAALSISNEGKRDVSAQVEPMFRRCDLRALEVAAMVCRLHELGAFPESGYTIAYQQIPRTPDEEANRRERLQWELANGLISQLDVYVQLNPGATREDASAALRLVEEDQAAIRASSLAATGGDGAVQDTALNGAQVTALADLLRSVTAREMAPEAARLVIEASFPEIEAATTQKMVTAAAGLEPAGDPANDPPADPAGDELDPDPDEPATDPEEP